MSNSNRVFDVTIDSVDLKATDKSKFGTAKVSVKSKGVRVKKITVNLSPLVKYNLKRDLDKYVGKTFSSTVTDKDYQSNPFKIISFVEKFKEKETLINHRLEMVFEGKVKKIKEFILGIENTRWIPSYLKSSQYRRFVKVVLSK